ncbi:MAG TPA: zinc ribbon domain-containing protein [Pyrinomonadaceae bacterium]|nr:zinc ribbon domain-containing protein [Pyrinomonadaceae bacterium]
MFCPNCGAKTSIEQKFCRACGLGLEKIALSLTEQLPEQKDDVGVVSEKERLERWGMAALSVFGVGILGLLLFFIVYKMMFVQGKLLNGLALLGMMIMGACGLIAVLLFAKAKEVEESAGKRRIQQKQADAIPTPTKELLTEGHLEPVPSVTDRTTDLLYAEKKDAQRR